MISDLTKNFVVPSSKMLKKSKRAHMKQCNKRNWIHKAAAAAIRWTYLVAGCWGTTASAKAARVRGGAPYTWWGAGMESPRPDSTMQCWCHLGSHGSKERCPCSCGHAHWIQSTIFRPCLCFLLHILALPPSYIFMNNNRDRSYGLRVGSELRIRPVLRVFGSGKGQGQGTR
jgi:hypothetical protein